MQPISMTKEARLRRICFVPLIASTERKALIKRSWATFKKSDVLFSQIVLQVYCPNDIMALDFVEKISRRLNVQFIRVQPAPPIPVDSSASVSVEHFRSYRF